MPPVVLPLLFLGLVLVLLGVLGVFFLIIPRKQRGESVAGAGALSIALLVLAVAAIATASVVAIAAVT